MLDRLATVKVIGTPEDLRAEPPTQPYRLALLDLGGLSFGDPTAASQVAQVREILSDTPLVVLSDHDEPDEIVRAFRAGVQGFLPASSRPEVAAGALELVLAGGMYFPPSLPALTAQSTPVDHALVPVGPQPSWRSREQAVADHLIKGEPNKVIARELGLQESTVKEYVRQIMKKLGANNRTRAALTLATLSGAKGANGYVVLGPPHETNIGSPPEHGQLR